MTKVVKISDHMLKNAPKAAALRDPRVDGIECPAAIIRPDQNGQLVLAMANTAFAAAMGKRHEAIIGQVLWVALDEGWVEPFVRACKASLENRVASTVRTTYRGRTRVQHWQCALTPSIDAQGDVTELFAVAMNISEPIEEIEKLNRENASLRKAHRKLHTFQSMIAHDLRAPLRAISSVLTSDNRLEVDLRERIGLVRRGTRDLLGQLDDMLQYSDAIAAETKIGHVAFDFDAMCEDLLCGPDIPLNIAVSVAPSRVYSDQVMVAMILRNLMSNAVRFARRKIALSCAPSEAGFIRIRVEDDGPGFSQEGRKTAEKRDFAQTYGYGLAAIRELASVFGGRMFLDRKSTLGGACIDVVFPGALVDAVGAGPRPFQAPGPDLSFPGSTGP